MTGDRGGATAVRAAGVMPALFRAFDVTLPTTMTAAYRLGALGMIQELGRMTPGDEYACLVPLMEAIPAWLHVLLVAAAGACCLVAVVCLLGRRRAARGALLRGVRRVCSRAQSSPQPELSLHPNRALAAAVLVPVVLPLLMAFAAWSGSRYNSNLLRPA